MYIYYICELCRKILIMNLRCGFNKKQMEDTLKVGLIETTCKTVVVLM